MNNITKITNFINFGQNFSKNDLNDLLVVAMISLKTDKIVYYCNYLVFKVNI